MMQSYVYNSNSSSSTLNNNIDNMNRQYSSSLIVEQPERADSQTEEIASFLLSLKHSRSVSPEPHDYEQQEHEQQSIVLSPVMQPAQSLSDYSYEVCKSPKVRKEHTTDAIKVLPSRPTNIKSSSTVTMESTTKYDWNQLLDVSPLVLLEDRDLVPDALFVAMAQMHVCHLTQADRVGCYKERDIGFVGMSCKHCGGQPGFGRYYPNSVRSLAQTTTSQTILKHIGGKCRYAPSHIKAAVMQLQQEQAIQEGTVSGRPRYGSRKVFFQRVWSRLHGIDAPSTLDDDYVSKVSCASSTDGMSHVDMDDRSTLSGHSELEQHNLYASSVMQPIIHQHKRPFGRRLPLQQNKRMKMDNGSIYNV